MKITIIGVPLNLGCDRQGVEQAPDTLRRLGLLEALRRHNHRIFDCGNLYVSPVSERDKFRADIHLKYLDTIVEVNNNLAEMVYDTLRGGAFPIVIGGDHSLGLGSASGVGECFDDFGIIWLDAHGDINTPETTPSGNIHGMALAALMGRGSDSMVNLYAPGKKVNPQNIFLLGTRSLDPGEIELIEQESLSIYSMTLLREKGVDVVVRDLLAKIRQRHIRNIHFSMDVDVLDPSIAPGTGTREAGGMDREMFEGLVGAILQTNLVKSMDWVELNPQLDDDNRTARLSIELLDFVVSQL